MTQQVNVIQNLINFLDKGFVYIYRPVDELEIRSWLQTNTNHMEYLLNKYNKRLETCDLRKVTAQIIINGQLQHETSANNINATIQYFRDNATEFTNYEEKIVRIRYVFANSVSPDRVTQEELIKTASEYDICYRYLPIKYSNSMTWIKKNMNFLRDKTETNHKTLKECRYGITVEINGETRYASSAEDYESIVDYFRDNSEEFSNDVTKYVLIKYVVF
jgi:hypothetical protein